MINLQARSCTNKAPGTLIKLFAGCQTKAGRWAELSGWICVCPLATFLLNERKRGEKHTHAHSHRAQRGNDAPGAGRQHVPRLDGCRSSAAYTGELITGDGFASWVLHSTPLFATPSEKLGRSDFFLFLFEKILSFSIQYIFLGTILFLFHGELNEIKLFIIHSILKGFGDTHWGKDILQIQLKFKKDHFPFIITTRLDWGGLA